MLEHLTRIYAYTGLTFDDARKRPRATSGEQCPESLRLGSVASVQFPHDSSDGTPGSLVLDEGVCECHG